MTDDNFYVPTFEPPPLRVERPGELLWEFRKDYRTYSCELRYHADWGVEAQILKDGELLVTYGHDTRVLAVQWADEARELIESSDATR